MHSFTLDSGSFGAMMNGDCSSWRLPVVHKAWHTYCLVSSRTTLQPSDLKFLFRTSQSLVFVFFLSLLLSFLYSEFFFNVWFLCIILLEKPQRAFLLKPMVFLFYHHTFGVVWRVNVCKDSRWSNSKVAEPLKGGMSRPRVMEGMPLKGIMGLWSLNFPSLLLRSLGLWLVHRVSLPWYAALTRSHKSWAGTSATSIQNSQAVFPLQVNCSKVFC